MVQIGRPSASWGETEFARTGLLGRVLGGLESELEALEVSLTGPGVRKVGDRHQGGSKINATSRSSGGWNRWGRRGWRNHQGSRDRRDGLRRERAWLGCPKAQKRLTEIHGMTGMRQRVRRARCSQSRRLRGIGTREVGRRSHGSGVDWSRGVQSKVVLGIVQDGVENLDLGSRFLRKTRCVSSAGRSAGSHIGRERHGK